MSAFDKWWFDMWVNYGYIKRDDAEVIWNAALDAAAKVARGEYTRPQEDNIVAYTAKDIAAAIKRLKEVE
jgi:hypothetical protein